MLRNAFSYVFALLVGTMLGCSVLQTPTTEISTTSPTTQSVSIVYRVEEAATNAATTASASNGSMAKRAYILSLKYPHSKCKPGFARAEMVVESANSLNGNGESLSRRFANTLESVMPGVRMGEGVDEAWSMDVRYKDVEELIRKLEGQGFFVSLPPAGKGNAMLAAEVAGTTTARHWCEVAELDQLIRRVRENGKLVGHTGKAIDVGALIAKSAATSGSAPKSELLATPVSYAEPIERLPPIAR
jgi:hypothetical protein